MPIDFYDHLDVHHNNVNGFHPEQTTSANPTGVTEGEVWYDIGTHQLFYRDNAGSKVIADLRVLNLYPLPTGPLSLNSQKITSLADGTAANDAVNLGQLQGLSAGIDAKPSVRLHWRTSGAHGAPTSAAPNVVDSVTPAIGDRILHSDSSGDSDGGIYTVTSVGTGSNGVWARATDFDNWLEIPGAHTFVEEGTIYADTGWVCTNNAGGTLGSTAIVWTQFTSAAAYTAGAGLSLTVLDFSVNVDNASIEINTDILRVKALGITNAMLAGAIDLATKVTGTLAIANGGTGGNTAVLARQSLAVPKYVTMLNPAISANTWTTVTHNLGTGASTIVQFFDITTGFPQPMLNLSVRASSANAIEVKSTIAWSANLIQINFIGLGA